MKKIILLALLIFFITSSVQAVEWSQGEKYKDVVSVKGTCETDLTVYLLPQNSDESVYSGGVRCVNGQFSYKDNLKQWNIPKGKYRLVIGKDNKKDFSRVEEVESSGEREAVPTPVSAVSDSQVVDDNPTNRFAKGVENLYSTSHSLTDQIGRMRQDLSQTSYPEPMKNILDSILSVIESKLTGVFDGINKLIEMIIKPEEKKEETILTSPIPTESPVTDLSQEATSSSRLDQTSSVSADSAH